MALTRLKASNILDSDFKSSCRVTTATNITLSGGAPNVVDGVTLIKNDRVLVRGQSTTSENGIYKVSTVGTGSNGTWVRDVDGSVNNSITSGTLVYIESGSLYAGKFYYLTTTGSITIGTTGLSFSDLLGSVATTAISNGNSNVSVAANSNVTVSVAGNSNIVTVTGTGANISGTANITGNVDIGGNLTITGSLTVNGTTTTINSTTLTVDDLNIVLASGAADATAANGAGITIDGASATLNYISTSNTWTFDRGVTVNGIANITGNANVGNLGTAGLITATGNISGGNLTTGGVVSATGNVTGGNITTGGVVSATGNVTGGNITTAGALSVTGNANVGNLGTAGLITATGNVTGGNLTTGGDLAVNGGDITTTATTFNLLTANATTVNFANAATTLNIGSSSSTTTIAGDLQINGNDIKSSTGNAAIFLSDKDVTVVGNLTIQGVSTTIGTTDLTIQDSIINLHTNANLTPLTSNDGRDIGLRMHYYKTSDQHAFLGWDNTTGYLEYLETSTESSGVITGAYGTIKANIFIANVATGTAPFVVTSTTQVANLNVATAGSATTATSATTAGTVTTAAQPNITSVGTLSSLNVSGNANVGNLGTAGLITATGNVSGGNLTTAGALSSATASVTGNANVGNLGTAQVLASANIAAPQLISNIATGTAPLVVTSTTQVANLNVATAGSATTAGTVTTAAQPNITSVGTLSSLSVTGNANTGNLGTTTLIATTGNITTINSGLLQNGNSNVTITANGNVSVNAVGGERLVLTSTGANITGTLTSTGNLSINSNFTVNASNGNTSVAGTLGVTGAATLSSTLNVVGNANTGNLGTTTLIATTGNITTINSSLMQNGNSNVTITANGNVTINAVGGTRLVVTSTGANITGTANVSGNANVGNLGTAQVLASANITAPQLISNVATGTAPLVVTSTTQVANLNVATAGTAGTVTTAAQPNITSVGTLTSLTTSGRIQVTFDGSGDAGTVNNTTMLELQDNGATSTPSMAFHRPGAFATKIVLNTDNFLYFGGWSAAQGGQTLVAGNIQPGANATYSLGTTSLRYANVFGLASSAQYADLAEKYQSDSNYDPGTVVIFGGEHEITVTNKSHDTRVAGVISTAPAYLMNDDESKQGTWLPVALTGRVPTRVKGPVDKGDLVVASDISGIAIKLDNNAYLPGCIIGKTLEVIKDNSVKTIEVVIGRF